MLGLLVVLMCMGWLNLSGRAFHVFGYALLRVQTGSMAPTYEEGDFLLSKEIDTDLLEIGDVITFHSNDPGIKDMLNTHRIVDIETENGRRVFTTKGDAIEHVDSYKVYESDVFGITVGSVGFLKWLAKVLSIPWIFGVIVFFPLLLMIIGEVRTIIRVIRTVKLNKQLEALGLDPNDTTVSALAEKYGIGIFLNAAEELNSENGGDTAAEADTSDDTASETEIEDSEDTQDETTSENDENTSEEQISE